MSDRALEIADALNAALRVDAIYEGLRTDANDGTFALWSEDDLVAALHELGSALAPLRVHKAIVLDPDALPPGESERAARDVARNTEAMS